SMELAAQRLLTALPRTPASAGGINFGFDESAGASAILDAMFNFPDAETLTANSITIEKRIVRNQLAAGDGNTLTLILTKAPNGDTIALDVNYQKQVEMAQDLTDFSR